MGQHKINVSETAGQNVCPGVGAYGHGHMVMQWSCQQCHVGGMEQLLLYAALSHHYLLTSSAQEPASLFSSVHLHDEILPGLAGLMLLACAEISNAYTCPYNHSQHPQPVSKHADTAMLPVLV